MRFSTLLMTLAAAVSVHTSPVPQSTSTADQQAQQDTTLACRIFKSNFPGKVFVPGESTYTIENLNYWSATNYASPACVFQPSTSAEVSKAVKLAKSLQTRIALRGAGHLAAPDVSSLDGGLLIVMTKLTQLELIKNDTSLLVGPGHRWEAVYEYLEPKGLVVVGGRIAPVGVPGLLLNGGVSFYNGQYGWACDNVVNYEVVLPNGNIVQANAATNTDLFWALKGGSSNFGIVTRFELKTYTSRKVWAGVHVVAEDQLEAYKAAIVEFADKGSLDPKAAIAPGFISAAPGVYVGGAILFYDSETEEYPEALKMFTDIPSLSSNMGFKTMKEFAKELAAFAGTKNGSRQTFAVGSTRGTAEALEIIAKQFLGGLPELRKNVTSLSGTASITIQPITRGMIEKSEKAGGNALGLDKNKAPYFVHAHSLEWQSASDDEGIYAHVNNDLSIIQAKTAAIGAYDPFKYLGDAMAGQKIIESYGEANVNKLKAVQQKYDPEGIWKTLLPGGFKLTNDSHLEQKPCHHGGEYCPGDKPWKKFWWWWKPLIREILN